MAFVDAVKNDILNIQANQKWNETSAKTENGHLDYT